MENKSEDRLLSEWQENLFSFEEALKHHDNISETFYCEAIDPFCHKAGKLFFESLNRVTLPIDLPISYAIKPCGEGYNGQIYECFREYWLCVLALFSRQDAKFLKHWNIRNVELPFSTTLHERKIDWSWIKHEYELAEPYFINDFEQLKSVCEASIELCKLMIKLRKQQSLRVDVDKQIIFYKNNTYRLGGTSTWSIFKMLYEAKGDTVLNGDIAEASSQEHNIIIGELKRHLKREGAEDIASAIKQQQMVGYWLDFSVL